MRGVKFHTPPVNQGQSTEVSFAWEEGNLLLRRVDARGTVVHRLESASLWGISEERDRELDEWQPWSSPPPQWVLDLF